MPVTWGCNIDEEEEYDKRGLSKGGIMKSTFQERKVGFLLLTNDRRETSVVLRHDIRLMSDEKCDNVRCIVGGQRK